MLKHKKMSITKAKQSFKFENAIEFLTRFWKLKKKSLLTYEQYQEYYITALLKNALNPIYQIGGVSSQKAI